MDKKNTLTMGQLYEAYSFFHHESVRVFDVSVSKGKAFIFSHILFLCDTRLAAFLI